MKHVRNLSLVQPGNDSNVASVDYNVLEGKREPPRGRDGGQRWVDEEEENELIRSGGGWRGFGGGGNVTF